MNDIGHLNDTPAFGNEEEMEEGLTLDLSSIRNEKLWEELQMISDSLKDGLTDDNLEDCVEENIAYLDDLIQRYQ